MTTREAQVIRDACRDFAEAIRAVVETPVASLNTTPGPKGDAKSVSRATEDQEELYQKFKRRFIEEAKTDPVLLRLMTARPEIILELEPREVRIDGATLRGRIAKLMADGWLATPRATGAVRKELARTGTDPGGGGTLSDTLAAYRRDGFLVRDGDGWMIAADVQITREVVRKE